MLREAQHGPVLFVPAHPDDEVVGASVAIASCASDAVFAHVTDGSPQNLYDARNYGFDTRDAYRQARRRELEAALAIAGVRPERLKSLGAVDQEASFDLEGLTWRLEALVEELQPSEIWTHPYEGGHPDHDAAAFIAHAAVRLMRSRGGKPPRLVEFTSYHAKATGAAVCEFLPDGDCRNDTVVLSATERERKRRMLDCFETQRATLSIFPVGIERSRSAPSYDFSRPPHPGMLHYDRYDWGMRSEQWRELAGAALRGLGLT